MSTESKSPARRRRYVKRRRADREQETRGRITEAAVALHGSIGPARTTISAVAERAGVQRATVYRHFPDEASLFRACSSHWAAQHPLPDPGPWAEIEDPRARIEAALTVLYAYYRKAEPMLANVSRDAELMPALAAVGERRRRYLSEVEEILAAGWNGGDDAPRRAALALATDFGTWRLLVRRRGLSDSQAVELMARAVSCAGGPA